MIGVLLLGVLLVAPPDEFELARRLAESGRGELALEYLGDLAKANPSPEVQAELPLERANVNLAMFARSDDPGRRAALAAVARKDFDEFLAKGQGHPRRAEALAAVARLLYVNARLQVVAANGVANPTEKATAVAAARDELRDAAGRFGEAAQALKVRVDQATGRDKDRALLAATEARLDQARAQFQLARTYDGVTSASEVVERGKVYEAARKLFEQVAKDHPDHPARFVAEAWAAECTRLLGDPNRATAQFAELARNRAPEARPGVSLAEFFQVRGRYESALTARDRLAALRASERELERWLADNRPRGRPTPEQEAAQYYLGYARFAQALGLATRPENSTEVTVPPAARALLKRAERDFRAVAENFSEFAARATEFRNQAARLLIGNVDRLDPAAMTDPEDVALAARVQLARAVAAPDADRARLADRAVRFYERSARLPPPADESPEQLAERRVNRVAAYLLAGRVHEAAVVGEHLAQTLPATYAPRAGYSAVQAYLRASQGRPPEVARADLGRAAALVEQLGERFPADTDTSAARLAVAQQLFKLGDPQQAIRVAAAIPPVQPAAPAGVFLQSLAVQELFRPADDAPPVSDDDRKKLLALAIESAERLPTPTQSLPPDDRRVAALARLQLVDLYLLKSPPDLGAAQKQAESTRDLLDGLALQDDAKVELALRAEFALARVGYGLGLTAFQAKNPGETAARLAPLLSAADRGSVSVPDLPPQAGAVAKALDDFRRERVIPLAMQNQLAEGNLDGVAKLLTTLKKLGGSLGRSPGTLVALVDGIRPQLDSLRATGETAKADTLARSIGTVFEGIAAEPEVGPATLLVVARGLREFGTPDKALAVLDRVPGVDPSLLKPGAAIPEGESVAVARHRLRELEAIRVLRDLKRFDAANARVAAGLAWANPNEFRRENLYVIEAEATAAPAGQKQALWGQAYKGWNDLANAYRGPLTKVLAGKSNGKAAIVALLDLKALPPHPSLTVPEPQIRKEIGQSPPPDWLGPLLADADYQAKLTATLDRLDAALKPQYHDLLAESYRCLNLANEDIFAGDAGKLAPKYDSLAKALVELETRNADLAPAVRAKLARLVTSRDALKTAYESRGGQLFLPTR